MTVSRWTDLLDKFVKDRFGTDVPSAWVYMLADKREARAALKEYLAYCDTGAPGED